MFAEFLQYAVQWLQGYGFVSARTRFSASKALATAVRTLDAADSPTGYASVGHPCRAALIALGKELIQTFMIREGEAQPKADDARENLKVVLRHYWGSRVEEQREAMERIILGAWE